MDIKTMRADFNKLCEEALAIEKKYEGKDMPEDAGKAYSEKTEEAKALQKDIDRLEAKAELENMKTWGEQVRNPVLPFAEPGDRKTSVEQVAGYMTLGDYVIQSPQFKAWFDDGGPRARGSRGFSVEVPSTLHNRFKGPGGQEAVLVPLTHEQVKSVHERIESKALQVGPFSDLESKAVPTLGSGVIDSIRIPGLWRVTEDFEPTIRDLISVVPLGPTDTVAYLREDSLTRAAAETTDGSAKPEGTVSYTEQTSSVRTIPVWMPVLNQQLADMPQLRGLIDGRLTYDIRKREEEEIFYGDGVAPNLTGLFTIAGTTDIQQSTDYVAGDPLSAKIKLGATEIEVSGYMPNGIFMHPRDVYTLHSERGTDDHYLNQVFPAAEGGFVIWALRIVKSVGTSATAGDSPEERNLIVGDFRRGCTIHEREGVTVSVGFINDDFTKNKRTILAEERIAFPIYAAAAFAHLRTVTANS